MAERSQTKKIVLIVVLAITLTIVLLVQFGGLSIGSDVNATSGVPSPDDQTGESFIATVESTAAPLANVQIPWKRPDPIGPVVRDPMRMDLQGALRAEAGASGEPNGLPRSLEQPRFIVTGIIFSTEQPSSIIVDGRILHEGDTIYGATVVKIAEQYADLSRGEKKWSIRPGQANQEP